MRERERARARVREIHEYLFREKIDANNTYHHYIRSIVLYINDDFTKKEEGKGLLFLSRQNGLLSPPPVETTKQSWCFLFFRNKLILKLIYNTQSKWQVGIDDRLFSSAHYCFPGGFASSVFFVGRY